IDLHVEHKPGRLFVVHAGDVEVEDIGTRFSVDYDGKNVDVRVTEGKVKVRRHGSEVEINASEAWTLELGKTTIVALADKAAAAAKAAPDNPPAPAPDNIAKATGSAGSGAKTASALPTNARKALLAAVPDESELVGTKDPKQAIDKYLEKLQQGMIDKTEALY